MVQSQYSPLAILGAEPQAPDRPQLTDALPDSFLPALLKFMTTTDQAKGWWREDGRVRGTREWGRKRSGTGGDEDGLGPSPQEPEPHRLQGQFSTGQTLLALPDS